jgi:hypothetical protein
MTHKFHEKQPPRPPGLEGFEVWEGNKFTGLDLYEMERGGAPRYAAVAFTTESSIYTLTAKEGTQEFKVTRTDHKGRPQSEFTGGIIELERGKPAPVVIHKPGAQGTDAAQIRHTGPVQEIYVKRKLQAEIETKA